MFHRTLTFYLSQCHLFIFIHPVFLMSLLLHFSVNVSFSYVSTSTSTGPLSTETWVSSFPLLSLLIQVVTSPFLPLKYIDTLSHWGFLNSWGVSFSRHAIECCVVFCTFPFPTSACLLNVKRYLNFISKASLARSKWTDHFSPHTILNSVVSRQLSHCTAIIFISSTLSIILFIQFLDNEIFEGNRCILLLNHYHPAWCLVSSNRSINQHVLMTWMSEQ